MKRKQGRKGSQGSFEYLRRYTRTREHQPIGTLVDVTLFSQCEGALLQISMDTPTIQDLLRRAAGQQLLLFTTVAGKRAFVMTSLKQGQFIEPKLAG